MKRTGGESKSAPASSHSPDPSVKGWQLAGLGPVFLAGLLLVLLTGAVFYPVAWCGFVHFDDDVYVVENPRVQAGVTWTNLKWAFQTTEGGNYIPLAWLSHMVDCQLYGLTAGGHHLTSLLIHIINVLLLFALLWQTTGSLWRSFSVAALFAIHPLHVESVAWVSERKDVLSTLFWFVALLAHARFARKPSWEAHITIFAAFILGLLAKPMTVTLPFTLLLLDYWPLRRWGVDGAEYQNSGGQGKTPGAQGFVHAVREKLPLFSAALLFSAIAFLAQKKANAMEFAQSIPWGQRVANAVLSYGIYIGKMLFPFHLAGFYSHPRSEASYGSAACCALALVVITGAVLRFGTRWRYLPVGWFWYLGTLVPVIGLVQVGRQGWADRYTYVPLLGLFMILVWGGADLCLRLPPLYRPAVRVVAAVLLGLLALRAHDQTSTWKDSRAYFSNIVRVSPMADMGHYNMGMVYDEEGRIQEAAGSYRQAIKIDPGRADAWNNLGIDLAKMGQSKEALEAFSRACEIHSQSDLYFLGRYNVGCTYQSMGYPEEALSAFAEVLKAHPDHVKARVQSAVVLEGMGRWDEAQRCYEEAATLSPKDPVPLLGLSRVYRQHKKTDEALKAGLKAVKLNPTGVEELTNLGTLCEELRMWPEAQMAFERAVQAHPGNAECWAYLALAYQNQDQTEEAMKSYAEAIRLKPELSGCRFNLGLLALKNGDKALALDQGRSLEKLDAKLARALLDRIRGAGPSLPPPQATTGRAGGQDR
jgi:protein O-mannosyl-transferase